MGEDAPIWAQLLQYGHSCFNMGVAAPVWAADPGWEQLLEYGNKCPNMDTVVPGGHRRSSISIAPILAKLLKYRHSGFNMGSCSGMKRADEFGHRARIKKVALVCIVTAVPVWARQLLYRHTYSHMVTATLIEAQVLQYGHSYSNMDNTRLP